MGKKKDKKGKKKKLNTEAALTADQNQAKDDSLDFQGNYKEFVAMKDELPNIPHGSPATDHIFDTEHGQLRVRVNPDMENGKAGRRNTQLDGKQIIAANLKTLLDSTPGSADAAGASGVGATADLLDAMYKKKDLKKQLQLMDISHDKMKDLPKKVNGVEIQAVLMQRFHCSASTVKDVLEALCR